MAVDKLERLLDRMDVAYGKRDVAGAVGLVQEIMLRDEAGQDALERVAMLLMDFDMLKDAERVLIRLQEKFTLNGYDYLLLTRWHYEQEDYEQAITLGQKAIDLGDMTPIQLAMASNMLGHIYRVLGELEKALPYFARAKSAMYLGGMKDENIVQMRLQDYSNYLFTLHYMDVSREFIYQESQGYGRLLAGIKQYRHKKSHHKHQKIRIGYISPDLRRHVVAFFSYPFFENYDHDRFEVYAYANNDEDRVSVEYASRIDGWRNIKNAAPAAVAAQIYKDEIDILVDLAGHTADNSLPVLAYKPAPVQISGIGYFDTTGLPAVDYVLADYFTDPLGMNDVFFHEKLLRLKHSHFCYMWHDDPKPILMSPYRRNGYVTFGSFNNFTKVNDRVLQVWGRIMSAVPDSRLLLKARIFNIAYGRKLALDRMKKAGIPLERVIIEGHETDYLSHYRNMDIALDTFPYPGGGTTCDALYMGVPVITLQGERHNSRFGYSILMNMGLEELCADSRDGYIQTAVALARDKQRLSHLHQTLRRRMRQSPVMDVALYMQEMEAAYQVVWQNFLLGNKAVDISILNEVAAEKALAEGRRFYIKIGGENGLLRARPWLAMAVRLEKASPEPAMLLSELCYQLKDHVGAYNMAKKAIELAKKENREQVRQFWSSIYCRLAFSAMSLGYREEAFAAYNEAWQHAQQDGDGQTLLGMYDSMLLSGHLLDFSSQDMYELHTIYEQLLRKVDTYTYEKPYNHKKIRIGYLTPDFRQHVMFPFYYGMIFCYDRAHFEVYCYHHNDLEDDYTEEIRKKVDSFVNVSGWDYAKIAAKIHADEIDVLVDLAGHSTRTALPVLAYKPAPVQMSGIGYLATTGLKTVDYFITDPIVDPPGQHEAYFTEKLLYLPSHFSYAVQSNAPQTKDTAASTKGYITFGVFNRYRKVTDTMLTAWLEIMAAVPDSHLLLKASEFDSESLTDAAYVRLQKIGFDMERVQFEKATGDYMERYLDVDIALDTYPYPGGGTTLDALYMGVPVVTLYGERRNTRFGLSILTHVGMEELAVDNLSDYKAKAIALAEDIELLNALHNQLRDMLLKAAALRPGNYVHCFERKIQEILGVKLSACYIVRNEADNLLETLPGIAGNVDELIVVDTGSTDNTVEVAASFGATVYAYPWNNDFAAARNYALAKCHGDWILFLDADERIPGELADNIKTVIKRAEDNGKRGLLLTLKNIDKDDNNRLIDEIYALRIFRNEPSLRYEGRIHEQLYDNGRELAGLALVPANLLYILHTGYSGTVTEQKARRNLPLLLQELQESDHPDRIYGYLADTYYGLGDRENALKYIRLDIAGGRKQKTGASRSFRLLLELMAGSGSKEQRLTAAQEAVATFPELPEFQAELAECQLTAGNLQAAIRAGRQALTLWESGMKVGNTLEKTSFTPAMAAMLRQRLSQWELAGVEVTEQPLVSIMIPTYNRPELFAQTLESCLLQDYPALEILVNDNSTNDDTEQLIQQFLGDARLHYLRNRKAKTKEENFAPFEQAAKGEYLQWLMDDDMLAPQKISRMIAVFQEHPQVKLVTSRRGVVNEEGRLLKQWDMPFEIKEPYQIFSGDELAVMTLRKGANFLGEPSAVLFRRADLQHHYWHADSNGYLTLSDVAMWLELLENGDAAIFAQPLSYYRKHMEQEGRQADVILLSRIEWLQLAYYYCKKNIFSYTRRDYKQLVDRLEEEFSTIRQSLAGEPSAAMWQRYCRSLEDAVEDTRGGL